jgi:hypothetical protein
MSTHKKLEGNIGAADWDHDHCLGFDEQNKLKGGSQIVCFVKENGVHIVVLCEKSISCEFLLVQSGTIIGWKLQGIDKLGTRNTWRHELTLSRLRE